MRIIDKKLTVNPSRWGPVTLTSCYIGYLLSLTVELQHHDYPPGAFTEDDD